MGKNMTFFGRACVATIASMALALSIGGCGGGGGSPGQVGLPSSIASTAQPPTAVVNPTPVAPPGPDLSGAAVPTATTTIVLTMVDSKKNLITAISSAQLGTLVAKCTDTRGAPVSGAIVTFRASNPVLVSFSNATSEVTTDTNGIATLGIGPSVINPGGTLTITAGAISPASTILYSNNLLIGVQP